PADRHNNLSFPTTLFRSYGKTDMPSEVGAYAIDFLTDDVLRLMDALGIEQATVVGHDWGALIGWHLAMHAPQRVSRYAALSVGQDRKSTRLNSSHVQISY